MRNMPCTGRVVDEQLGVAQHAAGLDKLLHVVGVETALAQFVAVYAGLAAQQAFGQFDARLLQTDEKDRLAFLDNDITGNVQGERRFADGRPRRDDNKLARSAVRP